MDSILNVTKREGGKTRESWPGMPHMTPEKYHYAQDGAGRWAPMVVQRIPTQSCLVFLNVFTCLSVEGWQCTHSDCSRGSAKRDTAAGLPHLAHVVTLGSVLVCVMPFLCFLHWVQAGCWGDGCTGRSPSPAAVRKTGMFCQGDMQDGPVTIRPLRLIVLPCFRGFETRKAGSCAEIEFTEP